MTKQKAFQLTANRQLSDSPNFIVNTFECVWRAGAYTVRSRLNKFEHIWEAAASVLGIGGAGAGPCEQND